VNFVIAIIVAIDIAKSFGQSAVFGFFLLFLLCGIGYLILGFGDYRYQGPPNVTGLCIPDGQPINVRREVDGDRGEYEGRSPYRPRR
jgi:hypothetical protein